MFGLVRVHGKTDVAAPGALWYTDASEGREDIG